MAAVSRGSDRCQQRRPARSAAARCALRNRGGLALGVCAPSSMICAACHQLPEQARLVHVHAKQRLSPAPSVTPKTLNPKP